MSRAVFCAVLCLGSGFAQSAEDPVLQIDGLCGAAKSCPVVVSRRQFEALASFLAPGGSLTLTARNRLAEAYGEALALESAAIESGIDQSIEFQERMRWFRAKTLGDLLRKRLEKESAVTPDAEIHAYYRAQLSKFEEVKLQRIVLPNRNFGAQDPQKFEQKAEQVAAQLRERAAQGEDPAQLQREGYEALEFGGAPPSVEAGIRRRAYLPAEVSEEIFSLRPGEVSKVKREAYGFVIYKVESKRMLPEELVREEIARELAKEKLASALKAITGRIRTELNESYFGTASAR